MPIWEWLMLLSLFLMMFLRFVFFDRKQLLFFMADLIASVADVSATCWLTFYWLMLLPMWWLMLLPMIYGWCYCHMWLMLLPLIDCYYVGWCYCQCDCWCYCQCIMADVFTICGRWNGHFYVMGWCYCPVADGIATWLECGQMLFAQVVDGMTTESITLV